MLTVGVSSNKSPFCIEVTEPIHFSVNGATGDRLLASAEIALTLVNTLQEHVTDVTFDLDLTGWRGCQLVVLLDELNGYASSRGYRVVGARVGEDLFADVGGTSVKHFDTALSFAIPLVPMTGFGCVQIVVRRISGHRGVSYGA